jgi:hypothetical protein
VQTLFTVDLPPGGKLPKGHTPVCNQTCIAGLQDEVLIMASLMKPKKITFIGRYGQPPGQLLCTCENENACKALPAAVLVWGCTKCTPQ